ncbi:hypothetical protein FRB90_012315 [Tulasnella sp. 427]|nr:hypothetical protein FRB90_012315 [Tulasnella sp. 427]
MASHGISRERLAYRAQIVQQPVPFIALRIRSSTSPLLPLHFPHPFCSSSSSTMSSEQLEVPIFGKPCWKYVLKAFKWARKGLRVNLDLHTIPGSQNGYNHSGKGGANGQINFLYGPMGLANAQRAIDYIRIITEFISQPEWAPVVPMFGIINEAVAGTIGVDQMAALYVLP